METAHNGAVAPEARQIRAVFDDQTIRIYQAYRHDIADSALANGTFVSPPFSLTRMTWVKPSFFWMMYRAGWGHKDAGQARIIAIDIDRAGFAWALANSCASHPPKGMTGDAWEALKAACPVRVQWDPERDVWLQPLPWRSIQVGLSGEAVRRYVASWVRRIEDVTRLAHEIGALVAQDRIEQAAELVPIEAPYPCPPIGRSAETPEP